MDGRADSRCRTCTTVGTETLNGHRYGNIELKSSVLANMEAARLTIIRKIHSTQYRERTDLQARIEALQGIISHIRDSHLPKDSKKRMLNHAIWEVSIARGDFVPEYRSKGVREGAVGTKIQREHVYRRKQIVEDVLKNEEPLEAILKRIIHCVVTTEEHSRLNSIPDKTMDGWPRYRAANIEVFKCAEQQPVKVQYLPT